MCFKKLNVISVFHINKEFKRIWKKLNQLEALLSGDNILSNEKEAKSSSVIVDGAVVNDVSENVQDIGNTEEQKADAEIEEFEQVKKIAESLGIKVRSNSKIETLKQKIAEKQNA